MNFLGKKVNEDDLIIRELLSESIGFATAQALMNYVGLTCSVKMKDLLGFEERLNILEKIIRELRLKRVIMTKSFFNFWCSQNVKVKIENGSIQGFRLRSFLPVAGQRTKTNCRTNKRFRNKKKKKNGL
jgi:ribosomal protein S13